MEKLRHIFILVLSLAIFYLGAGTAFVHICSSFCRTNVCESANHMSAHTCCKQTDYSHEGLHSDTCDCLKATYQIDFFQNGNQKACHPFILFPLDLPKRICWHLLPAEQKNIAEIIPHAPPLPGGRNLLALHATLII